MKTLLGILLFSIGTSLAQSPPVYFRTNIAGYLPEDSKLAVIITNKTLKGNFEVRNEAGKKMLAGKIKRSNADGFAPFKNFYTVDFSALKEEGNYTIELDRGRIKSNTISINASSYRGTPDVLLGFMRQQRCGYNPFFDEVCHQKDGRMMGTPASDSTYVDARGDGMMQEIS